MSVSGKERRFNDPHPGKIQAIRWVPTGSEYVGCSGRFCHRFMTSVQLSLQKLRGTHNVCLQNGPDWRVPMIIQSIVQLFIQSDKIIESGMSWFVFANQKMSLIWMKQSIIIYNPAHTSANTKHEPRQIYYSLQSWRLSSFYLSTAQGYQKPLSSCRLPEALFETCTDIPMWTNIYIYI